MLKVGLIGCGFMGAMHANCYKNIKGVEIAAVADIRREKAEAVAAGTNAKIYSDGRELIEAGGLDIIDVCLPTYLHAEYGMLAMEYLKENHKTRYQSLLRFGRLTEKLKEVEEEANQMLDHLMQSYLKNHPPKDRHSTMEMWKIRQQGMMMAEEIVMKEIVNQYH